MKSSTKAPPRRFGDAPPSFRSADGGVEFQIALSASGVVVRRSEREGPAIGVDASALLLEAKTFLNCCKLDSALNADPQLEAELVNLFGVVHGKVGALPRARRSMKSDDQMSSDVVGAIRRVRDATSVDQVLEAMHLATRALGAGASFYMRVDSGTDIGRMVRLLLDCDPAWCYGYGRGRHWALDPWIGELLLNTNPVVDSDLQPCDEPPGSVVELRRQSGFVSSMLIPVRGGNDFAGYGGLCLGSPVPGQFEDEPAGIVKVLARTLALEIHEWLLVNKNLDPYA